ncbi:hypothetical protein [Thermophilibacter provencensis]|uniref:Uncharacterized protein n=1 Tax=Thermophilibacter provencensis TaxID=1852386 RepID=A0ABT7V1S8_9ACTN|nr:hypothetical protein [Thermophilibacter provencensis]MDM8270570.1 hypothetical protein [Thermophilibacter provencensis]
MTGIERLREFAKGCRLIGQRAYSNAIGDIADQIASENIEDTEAVAWVREHGGLDSVKKRLDWVVGHCSTEQQLDFDFWLSGRVMHELGFDEDMAGRDEVERRLLSRLMPEDKEWPRYKDGAPVNFDDDVVDAEGFELKVKSFEFHPNGFTLHGEFDESHWYEEDDRLDYPAPKVLDADGVEIRVGDTVCGTRDMEPMRVVDTDYRECGFKRIKCEKEGEGFFFYYADELTHKLPILAVDDKPLREGETVWKLDDDRPYTLKRFDGEHVYINAGGSSFDTWTFPNKLTHERPVVGTWERLEEDVAGASCPDVYCVNHHVDASDTSYEWAMARDIVRRARELAGRDAS